jgi:hypothetical protein
LFGDDLLFNTPAGASSLAYYNDVLPLLPEAAAQEVKKYPRIQLKRCPTAYYQFLYLIGLC